MINEKKRLEDLISYQVLDTPPETELDEIAEITSLLFDVPISIVGFIDEKRHWFKAKVGLDFNENLRELSFCQHTLDLPEEVLVVEQPIKDDRFKEFPYVKGEPMVQFYAGAPLVSADGNVLGTLCVFDLKPRTMTEKQQRALKILANKAMDILEKRKVLLQQKNKIEENAAQLKKLTDNIPAGIFQLRMDTSNKASFEFISKGMQDLHPALDFNVLSEASMGFKFVHPEDRKGLNEKLLKSAATMSFLMHEFRMHTGKRYQWYIVNAKPERDSEGNTTWFGYTQNIDDRIEYEMAMQQISFDISHVLRRPVTSLLGLSELIQSEKEISNARLQEYVGYIREVSLEMESFTKDLNDLYEQKKNRILGNS